MNRHRAVPVTGIVLKGIILSLVSCVLGSSHLYGGEEVRASVIADHVNDQIKVDVAFGPTPLEYLVVYEHEYSVSDHDIYGRRVAIDGTPIAAQINIFTGTSSDFDPAVAYNTLANEYLVVWEHEYSVSDHDIYGWRLSGGGVLIGAAHVSTLTVSETAPSVVFNPVTNQYLVVWEAWQGTHHDIYGRLMLPDGTLTGAIITLADGSFDQSAPSVAIDTITGKYLAVWHEETATGEYDIRGRVVGADGSLPGGIIPISTWSNDQLVPDVAFNAASGSYLVVWEDHHWGTGADPDIYGQLVSGVGSLLGGNLGVSWDTPNDRLNPVVDHLSATGDFVVVWEYEAGLGDHDLYRRRVAGDGHLVEGEEAVAGTWSNEARPALAASNDLSFLTVWEDDRDSATLGIDVYGDVEELYRIEGHVYEGPVGDESAPLEGVAVELYCSYNQPQLGDLLSDTATDHTGWYGLITGATCEYFNVFEVDSSGYASLGATSIDGTVISDNWIQYTPFLSTKILTANSFWDEDTDPPPDGWASFTPSAWTNDQTPNCTVQVEDQVSGLDPSSALYRVSIDGGLNWTGWFPASCTGSPGSLGPETITAANVGFTQNSGLSGPNLIQFTISDIAGQDGTSGEYAVAIDTAPPNEPPAVWSSTHTPGAWSNDNTGVAEWSAGSDALSGVEGYSCQWDQNPGSIPDSIVDNTGLWSGSLPLADAVNWHFHVRTIDNAGNPSSAAVHLGPFLIDTVPPNSSVAALDPWQEDVFIDVSWGAFAGSGSPVVSYDVRVLDEIGGSTTVIDWLNNVTFTEMTFTGERGHQYSFLSRARDLAGNLESYPAVPDTTTVVGRDVDVYVRDEVGGAASGAKVYFNGNFLGTTDGAGHIVAPTALIEDELIALHQVHEEPAVKPHHGNYGTSNWAWRAYNTSLLFTPDGIPIPDQISDIHIPRNLMVWKDRSLIGAHMLVSVQFDATSAFLDNLQHGLRQASDYLYDVGDGQFFWEVIEVFDNGVHFTAGCDMEIHASNFGRAVAAGGGIQSGVTEHINMARYGEQTTNSWASGNGHRVMIHEFGHYGFHLWDEYLGRDNQSAASCATNFVTTTPPDDQASIMFAQNSSSELCSRINPSHQHESETQHDAQTGGESTWETTKRIYTDAALPPRWSIVTPDDRLAVMAGPDSVPIPSWTRVYINDADTGACPPFTQTLLYAASGTPVPQAFVWLDRPDPLPDLHQGLTSQIGEIEIVGAHDGDVFRATKGAVGIAYVISCSSENGNPPLILEPLPFDVDVNVIPLGPVSVRIDLTTSVSLSAVPSVVLWQPGATGTTPLTVVWDPGLGGYSGLATLDSSLELAGTVSVQATDLSANTRTVSEEFLLHQVTAAAGAIRMYSADGNLELFLPPNSITQDAVVAVETTSSRPTDQGDLQRVGPAYALHLSSGALVTPAGLLMNYGPYSGQGFDPESLDIHRWDEAGQSWLPLGATHIANVGVLSATASDLGVFALLGKSSVLFVDGFESSDTSAWSSTVP